MTDPSGGREEIPDDDLRFRDDRPRIHPSATLKHTQLGRHTEIGAHCALRETTLGDYSYFERFGEAAYADIGRFCSIAAMVRINALAHPMDRVTTHKISYRPNEYFRWRGVDRSVLDARRAKRVTIGHDVWIGHGAVVMPGIAIGDGAVIGANAVVTRDVEPYAVAVGTPARAIRHRFAPPIVARLEALAWWDLPVAALYEAVEDMRALSVEAFLERWERRHASRERNPDEPPSATRK